MIRCLYQGRHFVACIVHVLFSTVDVIAELLDSYILRSDL